MAREEKYQGGDFVNRSVGRNGSSGARTRDDRATDFEVTREELRGEGPYRGKGPKNYRRRDERILEDINDLMCDNAYLDASEIDVSVLDGNVILSGTVGTRESKRLAEDIAEAVSGVQNVENSLRVQVRGI